jgi:hypothetical protein
MRWGSDRRAAAAPEERAETDQAAEAQHAAGLGDDRQGRIVERKHGQLIVAKPAITIAADAGDQICGIQSPIIHQRIGRIVNAHVHR